MLTRGTNHLHFLKESEVEEVKFMKVPLCIAASLMDTTVDSLRCAMQRKEVDLGWAIKRSSRWTYNISPKKLSDYTGVRLADIHKMVVIYRKTGQFKSHEKRQFLMA